MKKLLTVILILFTATLFAQRESSFILISHGDGTATLPCEYWVNNPCTYNPVNKSYEWSKAKANSDTLIIPVGKYQYIKVGDKVYKLVTTLEEVKPEIKVDTMGYFFGGGRTTAVPNTQLAPFYLQDYSNNNLKLSEN